MNRRVILITGKTGTGKSRLIHLLLPSFPRLIILDPMEEYSGTIFTEYDTFSEYLKIHFQDETFQLVCRFTEEEDIDALFEAAWQVEDCCVTVEEANIYLDSRSQLYSFGRLVAQGRHKRISLVCTSQRVPDLPISFRAQKNTLVSFQQTEPRDLDYLEKYGFDPDAVSALVSSKGSNVLIEGTHYLVNGETLFEEENFSVPEL